MVRRFLGPDQFKAWGWRVPFLVSILLLGISLWIRLKLDESPEFKKMKEEGRVSTAPLTEAFGQWSILKLVLLSLFGIVIGQAVVWYTGLFYSMFFLMQTLKVDTIAASLLIITAYANPAIAAAQARPPVQIIADPADCSVQFNATGANTFSTPCDIVTAKVAKTGLPSVRIPAPAGSVAKVKIGGSEVAGYDGKATDAKAKDKALDAALAETLKREGYAVGAADLAAMNVPMTLLVLVTMMMFGTMTYGALAAMLVELFPSRIRYTAMSLPYHIGIGWFGGFLPAAAFAIVAATGHPYAGLWYPTILAAIAFVVCLVFARETRKVDIFDPALRQAQPVGCLQARAVDSRWPR